MNEAIFPDDLPILTEIVDGAGEAILPTPNNTSVTQQHLPHVFSEAELAEFLLQVEHHLDSEFSAKLHRYLLQFNHQAVQMAIAELKSELPELVRKALNSPEK